LLRYNYRSRKNRFWNTLKDIVIIIQANKSQVSESYYIEFGIIPLLFVTKEYPPSVEFCPEGGRATDLRHSPYLYVYKRIESDGVYDPESLGMAVEWLMQWIHLHYGDVEKLRSKFLSIPSDDLFDDKNLLYDWANGVLKHPKFYFSGNIDYYE
jgi:hypothetical protein